MICVTATLTVQRFWFQREQVIQMWKNPETI
jgi:hypothetical protein